MSKYYSINKFSKILGVSDQTLRNWDKKGKLHPHHTSSNGYRYYSHEQLNQVMNVKPNLDRIVIGYCRVSSNKQKDDLERQIENMKLYLTAQGKPFEIISDIGSGIDYKKKYVTLKYESCVYYRISYRIKSPSGEREDRQCIRWMRVCAIVKWMKRIG